MPIEISSECSDLLTPLVNSKDGEEPASATPAPRKIQSHPTGGLTEPKRPPQLGRRAATPKGLTGASDLLAGVEPLTNPSPSSQQRPTPSSALPRRERSAASTKSGEAAARGPIDRRRQRRMPFDDQIEIWQRSSAGRADRFAAWGLNISSGGVRVIFTRELAAGERVGIQLRRDRHALPGRVAWVKPQADGCVAGISFGV